MSNNPELVSEENFYNHLTLGLQKTLEETAGVEDIKLEVREPCEKSAINAWEQRYSCILPYDLKNFYLSTDGFLLTWSYTISGEIICIGNLNINSLMQLQRIAGMAINNNDNEGYPSITDLDLLVPKTQQDIPLFKSTCKIFILDPCRDIASVCLVYVEHKINPSIWLLDRSLEWHFLASTFTQYLRMMLVYHGLPEWQLHLTSVGLAPWADQIMYSFMPHLNSPPSFRKNIVTNEAQLDSSIFRMKSKHSRRSKQTESQEPAENPKTNKSSKTDLPPKSEVTAVTAFTKRNY